MSVILSYNVHVYYCVNMSVILSQNLHISVSSGYELVQIVSPYAVCIYEPQRGKHVVPDTFSMYKP